MQFLKKKYYCLDPLLYNAKIEFWLIHITIVKNHETYLQSEVITLFTFITRAPFSCTISLAIFLAQKSRTVHLSSGVMNWFLAFSHSVFSKDTTTARGAKESNFQFRSLNNFFSLVLPIIFRKKDALVGTVVKDIGTRAALVSLSVGQIFDFYHNHAERRLVILWSQ